MVCSECAHACSVCSECTSNSFNVAAHNCLNIHSLQIVYTELICLALAGADPGIQKGGGGGGIVNKSGGGYPSGAKTSVIRIYVLHVNSFLGWACRFHGPQVFFLYSAIARKSKPYYQWRIQEIWRVCVCVWGGGGGGFTNGRKYTFGFSTVSLLLFRIIYGISILFLLTTDKNCTCVYAKAL